MHLRPLRPLHPAASSCNHPAPSCTQLRPLQPSAYLRTPRTPGAPCTPGLHPPPSTLLQFARPGAPYDNEGDPYEGGARGVNDYVKSLEFPVDSPWRKNRG